MNSAMDYPLLVFVFSFFVPSLSAGIWDSFLRSWRKLEEDIHDDFGAILAAEEIDANRS